MSAACGSARSKDAPKASEASDGGGQQEDTDRCPELEHARNLLKHGDGMASRAEALTLADSVGIAVQRLRNNQRAEASLVVGDIRRRAYRTFHTDVDALEAAEQYKVASRVEDVALACEASLASLLLAQEIKGDPTSAFEAAYLASRRSTNAQCQPYYAHALEDLGGYRPNPGRLIDLDGVVAQEKRVPLAHSAATDGAVVAPGPEMRTGPATVEGIDAFGGRDAARVVIQLSGPASFEVGYIDGSREDARPRLFIDLANTRRGKATKVKDVGGIVSKVRLGNHGSKTRVVLDLERSVQRRVFFLPEPFRVIVDVGTQAAAPSAVPGGGGQRHLERVVLDPGHGGADPGAVGPGGLKEKDVVLDIAHRAAPVLSRELGLATMLTRDDDRYVALEERTARANGFHADLFVSVHCNASESPEAKGIQSFVLDLTRDDVAMRVAARENATSEGAGSQLGAVLAGLRVEEASAQSQRFASILQQATMASLAGRYGDAQDGGVRSATFFVLLGAQMPATLFEASFISNAAEESRLASAEYRQKLADGISNAVRAYREGR